MAQRRNPAPPFFIGSCPTSARLRSALDPIALTGSVLFYTIPPVETAKGGKDLAGQALDHYQRSQEMLRQGN